MGSRAPQGHDTYSACALPTVPNGAPNSARPRPPRHADRHVGRSLTPSGVSTGPLFAVSAEGFSK